MTDKKDTKLLHHIAVGAGFIGLIAWYYILGIQLGFLDWMIQQMPPKYAGSGMMIGIMVLMTPGFFIWSRFNRWVEKKLSVSGIYYEDEYYKHQDELKKKAQDNDK